MRLKLTVFVFILLHFIFSYVTCVVLYMTSITKHSLTEVSQTCKNPAKPTYLFLEMYSQGFLASKGKWKHFSKNS